MHGIGWAVKELQDGNRVQRVGWNGKGMWLTLVERNWAGAIDAGCASSGGQGSLPADCIGNCAFVAMYTTDKKLVPWLCSQTDLLARDWQLAA